MLHGVVAMWMKRKKLLALDPVQRAANIPQAELISIATCDFFYSLL